MAPEFERDFFDLDPSQKTDLLGRIGLNSNFWRITNGNPDQGRVSLQKASLLLIERAAPHFLITRGEKGFLVKPTVRLCCCHGGNE